jgi:hypothetical protein
VLHTLFLLFCVLIAPRIDLKYNEVNRKIEQQSRDKIDDIHELLFSSGSRSRQIRNSINNNNNNITINNGMNAANLDEDEMKISTVNYNDSMIDGGNDDHFYNYHGRGNDSDIPQTPTIHRRGNVHVHVNDDHDHDDYDKDPTYDHSINIVQMIYAFFDVNKQ